MPETWAYCDPCTRWFYCGTDIARELVRCPVCESAPARIEERRDVVSARGDS